MISSDIMVLLVSIAISFLIGVALAFSRVQFYFKLALFIVLFGVSNVLINWKYFTGDPDSWVTTFLTGIFQTGVGSLIAHVFPAIIAYYVTLFIRNRHGSDRAHG